MCNACKYFVPLCFAFFSDFFPLFVNKFMPLLVSVFPQGCTSYNGLNPSECYETMWLEGGCAETGRKYPGKLPQDERTQLKLKNLA